MSKKARKEGNRVACLIKANKAEFYIADVDLNDNPDFILAAVECVKKTLGKKRCAFMIISAGVKLLTVITYVPDEFSERISGEKWLKESLLGLPEGKYDEGDNYFRSVTEANTPFKLKDMVRANGFAYLNKTGCIENESSSEEFIGFDDL